MPQLPFLVAPKAATRIVEAIVNDETCSIEFPVYGAITSGEEIDIADHLYQAAVYRESSRLADALVADGTEETDAQRIAIRVLSARMGIPVPLGPLEQRALIHHATLVAELQSSLATSYQQQVLRTATAAIRHRLPGCEAWTDADTAKLPRPLQAAIAAFIDTERNGDKPGKSPEELIDGMVETLGKLAPDNSDSSPPTGESSTGDAADSGQLLLSSTPTDSDASPPPTSPRRSKRVNAG